MFSESVLGPGAVLWRSCDAGPSPIPADGCVDLIAAGDRVWICGPQTRWLRSAGTDSEGMLGLRLSAGTALRLLPTDLPNLRDRSVDLGAALDGAAGQHAARLQDLMVRARESPAPQVLLTPLLEPLGAPQPWTALVDRAAGAGLASAQVAQRLECSQRSLRRRMLTAFGYGYTTLVRIRRAERARRLISCGTPLAQAAAEAGYADQSHMCRDFARFAGMSPGQLAGSAAKMSTASPSGSSTVA